MRRSGNQQIQGVQMGAQGAIRARREGLERDQELPCPAGDPWNIPVPSLAHPQVLQPSWTGHSCFPRTPGAHEEPVNYPGPGWWPQTGVGREDFMHRLCLSYIELCWEGKGAAGKLLGTAGMFWWCSSRLGSFNLSSVPALG